METYPTQDQPQNFWQKESILIKLGLIGVLTLLLLIPSSWIQTLIAERQQRQEEVNMEIADKWSGSQLLEGPVMMIPYREVGTVIDTNGKAKPTEVLTNIYLLPEKLEIRSKTKPEILHRGIFDAVVYNTKVSVGGRFGELELKKSGLKPDMILWDKAKLVVGLSDLKGLKNNPVMNYGKDNYSVEPDFSGMQLFKNNLVASTDLSVGKSTVNQFNFEIDVRGSKELSFLHLGKSTTVAIEGEWNNPSFTGRYLPENREVSDKSFKAGWKLSYFNRSFPQQWVNENTVLHRDSTEAAFGVKFILPVDQYQQTMRTAKYAILIIILTFISLFFTELFNKRKVHLLQYVLIGAAMTIYYTLLLSFSEQMGFNIAYLIASTATILLISIFISSLLGSRKPAIIFAGILTLFYSLIYVIIQLQDLALLFGSVGLFLIVAALMHFSSRIDWHKRPEKEVVFN